MSKQFKEPLLHIATVGKTVGVKGDMKLHIKSDFPEQFVKGAKFLSSFKEELKLTDVDLKRGIVKINGVDNPEDAKKFTNAKLYTTYEKTRENCHLEDGEYFFFDLEGCEVFENGERLGIVDEVERIAITNYLQIKTDEVLIKQGMAKKFLVPFIEPFKVLVNIQAKRIELCGAKDILIAS
jgi:16S rRNA processing protein RimM